ncbi:hypothetical protein FMM55_02015 [Campylobacter sp. LR196d]|uniref:hypothetical protein n=1 Tax=Campylobacter sp. LR196d TaxID=2593543 RepID=UPI00123C664F|nr:hypothetical protein [Campylobacter sp. LR196d]KAA6228151.1 hypothetical protein FMM55_02015 [Campylobacter sp. LR196d]
MKKIIYFLLFCLFISIVLNINNYLDYKALKKLYKETRLFNGDNIIQNEIKIQRKKDSLHFNED